MSLKRNSIIKFFSSPESSPPETEPTAKRPARPKYLNTPKYPGTSIPRTGYTPRRRKSSEETLGKRMRLAKGFATFPEISDNTPPSSPEASEETKENGKTPATLRLSQILKASQVETFKFEPATALLSPTDVRLAHFRALSVQDNIIETEVVDMRPDLLLDSPTRYVQNYMDTPPATPQVELDEENTTFLQMVSQAGNRLSMSFSTSTRESMVFTAPKSEKLAEDDEPIFHSTMKQTAPNPGKSLSLPNEPTQRKSSSNRTTTTTTILFQLSDGTGNPLPAVCEQRLRRSDPVAFTEYKQALAAARWMEHNAALAAERAELQEQGKMSFDELWKIAPRLIAQRGWLFDSEFPARERRVLEEREHATAAAAVAAKKIVVDSASAAADVAGPCPAGVTLLTKLVEGTPEALGSTAQGPAPCPAGTAMLQNLLIEPKGPGKISAAPPAPPVPCPAGPALLQKLVGGPAELGPSEPAPCPSGAVLLKRCVIVAPGPATADSSVSLAPCPSRATGPAVCPDGAALLKKLVVPDAEADSPAPSPCHTGAAFFKRCTVVVPGPTKTVSPAASTASWPSWTALLKRLVGADMKRLLKRRVERETVEVRCNYLAVKVVPELHELSIRRSATW
jgi:hypothetical protein